MATCPRCGKMVESETRFCPKCGLNLVEYAQHQASPVQETDLVPCHKHPGELTGLRCGRCDKPICTACVILGPAGPRCKECAKTDSVFRPAAIGLGAKRTAKSIFSGGVFKWYWLLLFGSLVFGMFRGCLNMVAPRPDPGQIERSGPSDDE